MEYSNGNSSFFSPMTEAEREQFDKYMKPYNQQFESSMHNLRRTLAKNLGSRKQNLANGFLQGLTADLNNTGSPCRDYQAQGVPSTPVYSNPSGWTGSPWRIYQAGCVPSTPVYSNPSGWTGAPWRVYLAGCVPSTPVYSNPSGWTDFKRTVLYMMLFAALLLAIIAVLVTSKQNIDCLEGQEECKNASTYILDGNAIKCCKNGYSMNSISNSFITGGRVEYCKCTRYNGNGGFSRPMTEAEREQFDKSMKQFNQHMQSSLHNLHEALVSLKQNLANGFLQGQAADLNNIGNQIVASNLQPEE